MFQPRENSIFSPSSIYFKPNEDGNLKKTVDHLFKLSSSSNIFQN